MGQQALTLQICQLRVQPPIGHEGHAEHQILVIRCQAVPDRDQRGLVVIMKSPHMDVPIGHEHKDLPVHQVDPADGMHGCVTHVGADESWSSSG